LVQRLRAVLRSYYLIYVIEEPLGDAPGADAGVMELEAHVVALNNAIAIRNLMHEVMVPHWRNLYLNHTPRDMMVDLIQRFYQKARMQKFDCISEFHSMKMDEGTLLEDHLLAMSRLYRRLTDVFTYRISDVIAVDTVMLSLPETYNGFIESYVTSNIELSFDEFLDHLRDQNVEPDEGEIIDEDEGIYLIYLL
jgi:hypothetical protein